MSVLQGKILIVDDQSTMIRIIKKFMEEFGFTDIDTAANGEEAWALIEKTDYTLIVSDWNMEPVTGLELLKLVRGNDRTSKIPFLMVTAESKPTNVLAAKKAGVSNYVVKPFNAGTLRGKVESVLGALA